MRIIKHALVTCPLPRVKGMAEDYEALKARKLFKAWARGHNYKKSRQRAIGAKGLWLYRPERFKYNTECPR